MSDRFYLPDAWADRVLLSNTEAHHLSRVMRKQVGDQVELFNGRGEFAQAVVETISKREVSLRITEVQHDLPRTTSTLTLAVAPPKGDRFRWLIEKVTEIGVDRLIPLKTERSVVEPGANKITKLEQTIISACKQCRRNHLLDITETMLLEELPSKMNQDNSLLITGTPTGVPIINLAQSMASRSEICIVVGPEGGLTADEEQFLERSGSQPIKLSDNILRVETAAIAISAAIAAFSAS